MEKRISIRFALKVLNKIAAPGTAMSAVPVETGANGIARRAIAAPTDTQCHAIDAKEKVRFTTNGKYAPSLRDGLAD